MYKVDADELRSVGVFQSIGGVPGWRTRWRTTGHVGPSCDGKSKRENVLKNDGTMMIYIYIHI